MEIFCNINYNLVIAIVALIVAIIALCVSFRATRYQIITLLNVQLAEKAKVCNENLDPKDLSKVLKQNDKVSGILSSIITAEEILNYQFYLRRNIFLKRSDWYYLVDQFYLQIHTTIRVFLQKGQLIENDIENKDQIGPIKEQYNRSIEFLLNSINRNQRKYFEKLHDYSLKRNKKVKKL